MKLGGGRRGRWRRWLFDCWIDGGFVSWGVGCWFGSVDFVYLIVAFDLGGFSFVGGGGSQFGSVGFGDWTAGN